MKWLSLPLALFALSACDSEKLPPGPDSPPMPKVEIPAEIPKPAEPLLPEPTVGNLNSDQGEPPDLQVDIAPVTTGELAQLPSEQVAPAPPSEPTPQSVKKKVAVEHVEVPEAELDLSLPEDWAENTEPEQNSASMSLLPPLFDSGERSRSLQMSGNLLPALDGEEVIDGAQLNFELKR